MATFRTYGVSIHEIRTPETWREALALMDAAMQDTGSALFASVEGWDFPMSMPDMLLITSMYGKDAYKVMPFKPEGQISDAEVEAAHEQLLSEIKFS